MIFTTAKTSSRPKKVSISSWIQDAQAFLNSVPEVLISLREVGPVKLLPSPISSRPCLWPDESPGEGIYVEGASTRPVADRPWSRGTAEPHTKQLPATHQIGSIPTVQKYIR